MKRKLPRDLGLAGAALLSLGLTAWVLAHAGRPVPGEARGPGTALASLWDRLAAGRPSPRPAQREPDAGGLLERLGVPAWHAEGYRGRGLKVAVLDSGFGGYRAALGDVLPGRVLARSFRRDGDLEARSSPHGILCAEVVHALAPEAELLLANWEPDQPEQFLEAVRWARARGARVFSCSVIVPTWSDGEGHGPVHEALAGALGPGDSAGDALFFASAGNTALRHWGGPYRPGPGGWHSWRPGRTDNPVRPFGDERVSVELCAPAGVPFELVVDDTTAGTELGRANSGGEGPGRAAVRFDPRPGHEYCARVRPAGPVEAPPPGFHLTVLGGRLQYAVRHGSIPFPGDGPEVVAVGAVNAGGRRLRYSSCGDACGHPKPDLVAAVPFPSSWRAGHAFGGTSAAAPQAAALAALLWSRHPDWSAERVRAALRDSARPLAPGPHSPETGYGLLRLP